jgi:pimeloyl-ACP methyl ester carboxylesterase
VRKIPKTLTAALAPALLVGGVVAGAGTASATPRIVKCPSPIVAGDSVRCGTLKDGATYLIEVPPHWNKTLFLYSHGYVVPGDANPAEDVGDSVTGSWMLKHGYALAGSSYSLTGWAIAAALPDQYATVQTFGKLYGTPKRVIAWGHSLGGIITAGLIQRYPHAFTAALPMCGVLSGGVATWNTALDAALVFKVLADPKIQIVHIKNPEANLFNALNVLGTIQPTAKGRARIALAAALSDTPGWYTSLSAQPAATNYAAQEKNQYQWDANVDFPFVFAFRAQLEALAGGNPSWTTGVNFSQQLAKSANLKEVEALYKAAHLSLRADLRKIQHAAKIKADPKAVSYLAKNISFTGRINIPVLTLHTTGDGLVVPENEQAYAQAVRKAGDSSLLRQLFIHRAGHCAFTPAETVTAVQALISRLRTGHWPALSPATMNTAAKALGPTYNIFFDGKKIVATAPAYIKFTPTAYLRPYDLSQKIHS